MITFIILIAKVIIFGFIYFILIGLLNTILANLGRLFTIQKFASLFYSIIITIVYIYIYSFWGAYLKSIVDTYSIIYSKKWLLIILCIISILPWIKFINKQLQEERLKMENYTSVFSSSSNQEAYMQSITVISFSMSIFIVISFIVFLFTNNFNDKLYFGLSTYLSELFV